MHCWELREERPGMLFPKPKLFKSRICLEIGPEPKPKLEKKGAFNLRNNSTYISFEDSDSLNIYHLHNFHEYIVFYNFRWFYVILNETNKEK